MVSRRGFTLIELLVVIAIIAILAAILFPVFAKAREKARQASCTSNLKQLALCAHMYKSDYDEKYPNGGVASANTGYCGGAKTCGFPATHHQMGAMAKLMPYAKNSQIFYCPSFGSDATTEANRAVPASANFWTGAGMIGWAGYGFLWTRSSDRNFYLTPDFYDSNEPIIMDQFDINNLGGSYVNCGTITVTSATAPKFPHNDTVNIAHNDGHVKSYQWTQGLFMGPSNRQITRYRCYP